MRIADFPFTRQATEHVREAGYSVEGLLEKRAFLPVRRRAADRVLGAIRDGIPSDYSHPEVELLSYPLARVIVSCIGDEYLLRRYALAEARLLRKRLPSKEASSLLPLAQDLGLHPAKEGDLVKLHFSEYLVPASRMRSSKWKLVNRAMKEGYLTVTMDELARLVEEMVREKVLKGLPLALEEGICEKLKEYINPLKAELSAAKAKDRVDLGQVQEGAFPPCIREMLNQVAAGTNLAHTARFALTSFLLQINMGVEEVMRVFNTSPDFDLERTRYQVEHIAGASGTKYKPPSCATMATYGNCPGEDELCRRISHPLGYYERRIRGMQRR